MSWPQFELGLTQAGESVDTRHRYGHGERPSAHDPDEETVREIDQEIIETVRSKSINILAAGWSACPMGR
jgi:hypothetical protein